MSSRADELLDDLIKGKSVEELIGKGGLLNQLRKRLIERAMDGELTNHLGYDKHSPTGKNTGNSRNGKSSKTLITDDGKLDITVPRDRKGNFSPQIVKKGQRRFTGFDDKIVSMYALGMTTRDIGRHLQDIYGVEVSSSLISEVTDEVIQDVREWQNRPLDRLYPILYLDALVVKVKDQGQVINKHAYLAIGVTTEGLKDVLGIWLEETEGAKFWLKVVTELRNRGLEDIMIACVDGLKGFPEAIEDVYPNAEIQLCLVHMIRNSMKYVSYKNRKELVTDLKEIYKAPTVEAAETGLTAFEQKWDNKYPLIGKSWRANWERLIPFLAYPEELRKIIYTTNAIESLNFSLRKILKTRASFPNDDAVLKLLYLGIRNQKKKWTMPYKEWGFILNILAVRFEGKITL